MNLYIYETIMSKGFKNNSKIDKDKKEMGNKVCCQNSNNESS